MTLQLRRCLLVRECPGPACHWPTPLNRRADPSQTGAWTTPIAGYQPTHRHLRCTMLQYDLICCSKYLCRPQSACMTLDLPDTTVPPRSSICRNGRVACARRAAKYKPETRPLSALDRHRPQSHRRIFALLAALSLSTQCNKPCEPSPPLWGPFFRCGLRYTFYDFYR